MKLKSLFFSLLIFSSLVLAEDLALPMADPSAPMSGPTEFLRPTVIIRPPIPTAGVSTARPEKPENGRELALLEMERKIIESQLRFEIAHAHRTGNATELKQVIIISGPVDASISRAPRPPAASEGRVALIGLPPSVSASKTLDQFFGVPMTPERERQLLETVKTQLANAPDNAGMDVRIAGWWPLEGVMAVSVMPKS